MKKKNRARNVERIQKLKNNKVLRVLSLVLVYLFSTLGISFSYAFAVNLSDVQFYSVLMAVDHEVKQQKNLNYLHGYVTYSKAMSNEDIYKDAIGLQYKTIYKEKYYDSYLVSSNQNETIHYDIDTNITGVSWNSASIVMVRNFWDGTFMESMALPLFWNNTGSDKNNIRAKNEKAQFGSYVSTSTAYDIVSNNGMLAANDGDISKAFTALIEDKEFVYTANANDRSCTFTINNIYIDPSFDNLLTKDQKQSYSSVYDHYYKTFYYWNKDAIVTYAPTLFQKGSTYYFDIRDNYSNSDLFIGNVLGKEYSQRGLSINLKTESKDLKELSARLDKLSNKESKANFVFLILAIICFEALLFVHFNSLAFAVKGKRKLGAIIRHLSPLLPFVFLQVILYPLLLLLNNYYLIYSIFSFSGNIIILVFLVLIILSGFVWRVLDEDSTKQN